MIAINYLSTRLISSLFSVALLAAATSCTLQSTTQVAAAYQAPQFRVRAVEEASLNGLDVLPLREPADMNLARR
ncbi:MAG: hypothetical protein EOO56_21270, partial [Hymenobacter sp.]